MWLVDVQFFVRVDRHNRLTQSQSSSFACVLGHCSGHSIVFSRGYLEYDDGYVPALAAVRVRWGSADHKTSTKTLHLFLPTRCTVFGHVELMSWVPPPTSIRLGYVAPSERYYRAVEAHPPHCTKQLAMPRTLQS